MRIISHRGNLSGPGQDENSPVAIDRAIAAGFDVEVDLRLLGFDWCLGHDYPQHQVTFSWIHARSGHLLLHMKDIEAVKRATAEVSGWHFFCHSADPFTITSKNFIWLHDLSLEPDANTIIPLISENSLRALTTCHAVCTDFPLVARTMKTAA